MQEKANLIKQYLLASDFDQTLSFNDSGFVLSELLGIPAEVFEQKTRELARLNLVQQGGELAYLLLHDPEYRSKVQKEHLIEAGQRIRLKQNIASLFQLLGNGIEGYRFDFYVISAAPEEVIQSALKNIIPGGHIYGTKFRYDGSGQIESLERVTAGYGKVALLDDLQTKHEISHDRIVYVGDGSSDIHVMLHVNRRDGFTIAVSEAKHIAQIAKRTILSDDAMSVIIPVLEQIVGWDSSRIRGLFEQHGFLIQEWDKVRTDWLTIRHSPAGMRPVREALLNVANA
jgi:2-hydroxy-3-keto-5-methylthiopentenyl-1-phosphate phosphatase